MSCARHFLFFQWHHHDWGRRVSATAGHWSPHSDMWGRTITTEHVTCHEEYVCRSCGRTRDGEECSCGRAKADQCAVRLALFDGADGHQKGTQLTVRHEFQPT